MTSLHEALAVPHCPEGVRIANLRASIRVWRASNPDETSIGDLTKALTQGSLRSMGGWKLMRCMRDHLGDIEPKRLTLIWLASVHEHPDLTQVPLEELAQRFLGGSLALGEYLPMERSAAA